MNENDTKKYYFSITIAKNVGVEEAIMFSNLYFWVTHNKRHRRNLHEGKHWTFNSVTSFAEQYPFWTISQIRRILNNLKKQGYIEIGRFNKKGYDKTKWYTITDFALNIAETDTDFVETIKLIEPISPTHTR